MGLDFQRRIGMFARCRRDPTAGADHSGHLPRGQPGAELAVAGAAPYVVDPFPRQVAHDALLLPVGAALHHAAVLEHRELLGRPMAVFE